MSILTTIKKIFKGDELDWHNPLPPVVGPDEALVSCRHCRKTYVIDKSLVRAYNYCFSCM